MKANAIVRFKFNSKRQLEIFWKALKPELEKPATSRFKGFMEKRGNFLVLNVEARDTVALRAALNAYLRWIHAMMNILELLEKKTICH